MNLNQSIESDFQFKFIFKKIQVGKKQKKTLDISRTWLLMKFYHESDDLVEIRILLLWLIQYSKEQEKSETLYSEFSDDENESELFF